MNTQQTTQSIKFSNSFTPEVDKYIEATQKNNEKPTVAGFAKHIGTDEKSIWAWATKHKKDEKGNTTDQLARPNFFAAVQKIKKMEDQNKERKLNPQQELFCQLYSTDKEFFANGTQAYIEAYGIDLSRKGAYNAARADASRLLTNGNILKRINELLELRGLNDAFVDKQLEFVITQNADFSSKVAAIREYNKLKQRITDKMDLTSKGKAIPILGGISKDAIHADNSNN